MKSVFVVTLALLFERGSAAGLNAFETNTSTAQGQGSVAIGLNNDASGEGSVAMGKLNFAANPSSVAMGRANNANDMGDGNGYAAHINGEGSVAMGIENLAEGDISVAMGGVNGARGYGSVAMGEGNQATHYAVAMGGGNQAGDGAAGVASVTMGSLNQAYGDYAVAMGVENQADFDSVASVAMGAGNIISGSYAVAMGSKNEAHGDASITFGYSNTAQNAASVAMGSKNEAHGVASVAMGRGAVSSPETASVALGHYNTGISNAIFELGNGGCTVQTDQHGNDQGCLGESRSNAFEVLKTGETNFYTNVNIGAGKSLTIGGKTLDADTLQKLLNLVAAVDGLTDAAEKDCLKQRYNLLGTCFNDFNGDA